MGRRQRVAVVGGGAMGASAAWHLARRGHDVEVLEQFDRNHDRGSSHGDARIFRIAHTDPWWTALAREAAAGWDEFQEASGRTLLRPVGGLDHGHPQLVDEVAASCRRAGIDHERLDPDVARERWPGLRTDRAVVVHPAGATTDAAGTVAALLALAEDAGAIVHTHTPVDAVTVQGGRAHVRRRGGGSTAHDHVVVTAGPWTAGVLGGLVDLPPLTVTREHPVEFAHDGTTSWPTVVHHLPSRSASAGPESTIRGYALPTLGGRVKVGEHHAGQAVDPGTTQTPDPAAVARVQAYVADWFPGLDPDTAVAGTCLYTTTPTMDFVVDRVGPVSVAAGFSGHGFKYVPWVGRTLADLVEGGIGPRRFRLRGRAEPTVGA